MFELAQWLRIPEEEVFAAGDRPVYLLRREFEAGDTTRASLRVSAQGIYIAYINGVRVGDEELRPGFTAYADHLQVQTYDVTALVASGRNALVIEVADGWFRGAIGVDQRPDQWGGHVAAAAELKMVTAAGGASVLATDSEWRFAPSHILAADLFRGQREDRRRMDRNAYLPSFDESAWRTPHLHEVTARLVPQAGPSVRRIAELAPVRIRRLRDRVHVVDFGQNINGWVRLSQLGPTGTLVTLTHGEALDQRGDVTLEHLGVDFPGIETKVDCHQVDEVISAGIAGDAFEPHFTTHGFQYVRVEGLSEVQADDIRAVIVHSDLRRIGGFASTDPRLQWLHDATEWSFRGNACEVPTDCPTRERAGWTGDWQLFAPTAAFLYDVDSWNQKWFADVLADQRENGVVVHMSPVEQIPMPGPFANTHGSAGWGDVIVSAPLDLYDAYGSTTALEQCWDGATAWMQYAQSTAATVRHSSRTGLELPHERYLWDGTFHFGEWLEPVSDMHDFMGFMHADKSEVATAYLARSAKQMARISSILGKGELVTAHFEALAEGARAAWATEFVDAAGRLKVRTQASHVRALHFGLVPEQLRAGIAADLVQLIREAGMHLGTGFLSTPYLLPVLVDSGHADVAFDLLFSDTEPSWMYMRSKGATTIWENWDGINAQGVASGSLNHYSKGAVASFLHRYVAGLRATEPGYRGFRVQPVLGGGVTDASIWHEAPHGRIEIAWRIVDETFRLAVLVPPGSTATAVLPDGSERVLAVGHNSVESRLHPLRSEPSLRRPAND